MGHHLAGRLLVDEDQEGMADLFVAVTLGVLTALEAGRVSLDHPIVLAAQKLLDENREWFIKPPTARQLAVFRFMCGAVDKTGLPPTVREIAAQFGIRSNNGVVRHLEALHRKGLLQKLPRRFRPWAPILGWRLRREPARHKASGGPAGLQDRDCAQLAPLRPAARFLRLPG